MMGQNRGNTVQGAVYEALKNGIMSLRLAPGTPMSTQEMASRLNVSRTPVRESFLRLQEEGLVDVYPQRETVVSRISLERVEQERFIRESMEIAIVDPFLQRCVDEDFVRLHELVRQQRECCAQKQCAEFVDLDDQMHRLLFERAGQMLAWQTVMNVTSHYRRIRVLTVRTEETMRGTLEQHEVILRLLREADAAGARAELLSHMRKIMTEKDALLREYPEYFAQGGEQPLQIGNL